MTALAAYVASRLAGVGSDRRERDAWFNALGLALRSNGVDRAAPRLGGAARPWLLVDEPALGIGLEKALVTFPGAGRRRPRLVEALARWGVARQIVVTRSRRDVVCVLLYREKEHDALFSAIEGLGEAFISEELLEEDRGLEASTWAALARRCAADELLLNDPQSPAELGC